MTSLLKSSPRRGATVASLLGVALASVLLFCGAGNAPIENFTPQGPMQADLNAGGHSITNAATVNATNVAVSGMLTANGSKLTGVHGYTSETLSAASTSTLSSLGRVSEETLTLNAGSAAYTVNRSLADASAQAGDTWEINISYPASTNPTLNIYDNSTGGTLLRTSSGTSVAGGATLQFAFNGTAWVAYPTGAILAKDIASYQGTTATTFAAGNDTRFPASVAGPRYGNGVGADTVETPSQAQTASVGGAFGAGVTGGLKTGVNSPGGFSLLNVNGINPNPANGITAVGLPVASPETVVFIGDSVTAGLYASSNYTTVAGEFFSQNFGRFSNIYNFGVSGYTTAGLLTTYNTAPSGPNFTTYNVATRAYSNFSGTTPHAILSAAGGGLAIMAPGYNDYVNGVVATGTITSGSLNTVASLVVNAGGSPLPVSNITVGWNAWQTASTAPYGQTLVGVVTSFSGTTAVVSGNFTAGTGVQVVFTSQLTAWESSYISLVNAALADNAKVIVNSLFPGGVPGSSTGANWTFFQGNRLLLNSWLASEFGSFAFSPNVYFADAGNIPDFAFANPNRVNYYNTVTNDFLHPGDLGYVVWARFLTQFCALNFPTTYSLNPFSYGSFPADWLYGINPTLGNLTTASTSYPFVYANSSNQSGVAPTGSGTVAKFYNSNMAAGSNLYLNVGSSDGAYGSVSLSYHYTANNSSSNYGGISFNGGSTVELFGSGDVSINSTTDYGYGLGVHGTIYSDATVKASTYLLAPQLELSGSFTDILSPGTNTAARTFTLPDASGTIGLLAKLTGTLSGGTATITNAAILAGSAVNACHLATSATNAGPLYVSALSNGSVTIKSANSSDNDTFVITLQ